VGGTIAAPAAVVNAVANALGVAVTSPPLGAVAVLEFAGGRASSAVQHVAGLLPVPGGRGDAQVAQLVLLDLAVRG